MVAICRLCASLKNSETLTFIPDNSHDLSMKLLKCCQLNIDLNNVLPRGVCPECIRNLSASFEFYVKVHESQQALEKILNVRNKIKNFGNISEEKKILEKQKSLDLIAAANASQEELSIGTEIQIGYAEVNKIDPMKMLEWSDDVDELSTVEKDNEIIIEHTRQKPLCTESADVKFKIRNFRGKTCEVDAKNEKPNNTIDSDVNTARMFDKQEIDFEFDEEPLVEVEEENQRNMKKNGKKFKKILRNPPYFDSESVSCSQEEYVSVGFDQGAINTSTWYDYVWKCVHCSQIFSTSRELAEHYKQVEEKECVWVCADCMKVFPRYYSLINHIRQRHRQHLGLCCDICSENFRSFAELDSHRQSLHDDLIFKMLICSKCGKGFKNTNSLQIHSKCHLPDNMRLQFSCNLCSKNFRSASSLKFHQKTHSGLKDFVCDQCGKKFTQRANLEEHLVTHIEFTPYECDLCSKLFKTSERLSKHKTCHTDDKPYKCNWTGCEKTFRTKDAMKSHGRIHTGEMPFQCLFCQKPFRFRSTLLTHHNIHTGIRPYSCNDCNHQFTNWPNYNKHMKRRHGIDVSSKNPRGKKPILQKKNTNKKEDPEKTNNTDGDKLSTDQEMYEYSVEEEHLEDEELQIIELEDFDPFYEPGSDFQLQ
ncbi:zinc finger protein 391-like [Eupeodes corollae]|uniref:zinc finger protein 391-like n=1 Tax=Eupeodes corollae TaxID=290404 RepID=UPI002492DFBF|nr:zinc finger protein 391-like [Eupeodes corollae]